MGADSNEFHSHDAFEKVLRKFCHPAAVADLDALPRGGASWRRLLESLATSCRDNAMNAMIDAEIINGKKMIRNNDSSCLLMQAMIDMGGPKMGEIMSDTICQRLKDTLSLYGRPLKPKAEMLYEHDYRVYCFNLQTKEKKAKGLVPTRTTHSSITKQADDAVIDWSSMRKIMVNGLKLYDDNKGRYLEGKLLVDPFTPRVGCTTILEDSHGDTILLALYNFLPDGLHGEESVPVASAKIPKGCTVRIACPFMKVFLDGSRGIRIDDPNEVSVISRDGTASTNEESAMTEAKSLGNSLVQKKKFNAASDAYICGLRKAELVPTLLSNRSQAFIMLEDWENALADAAASLVFTPDNKKTWSRYEKAAGCLVRNEGACAGGYELHVLNNILVEGKRVDSGCLDCNGSNPLELKDKGNDCFKQKEYTKAVQYYTTALRYAGEVPRALLGNWALCCLHSRANLDAIAAAAASLRIKPEGKALVRLSRGLLTIGEPTLCCSILRGKYSDLLQGNVIADRDELLRCSEEGSVYLKAFGIQETMQCSKPKYLPSWINGIEMYDAGMKGRGVRASTDLWTGQIVLIEPPTATAELDGGTADKLLLNIGNKGVETSTNELIKQVIILRAQREGTLSKIVDYLYDGKNQRPVTELKTLMPNLASCRILLPSHHEYLSHEKITMSAKRIEAIISVNAHGDSKLDYSQEHQDSSLYAALSMFNHSNKPTCAYTFIGGCAVISIIADKIMAGDELTICYHPDQEVVCRHWGITS
jgi:tetratricopeptide (TPR) repeat protein